jgi:hypothetical protein
MLNNMLISSKLRLNTTIVVVGLIILAILSYTSINHLQDSYNKAKQINKKVNNLKSVMIGGLLVNSASSVFAFNPESMKPIKVAANGLEKVKVYSKGLKEIDTTKLNSFVKSMETIKN